MIIKSLLFYFKKVYKTHIFTSNAKLGKNFKCTHDSYCSNKSKNKRNIEIGDNCEICGSLHIDETGKIIIGDYTTVRYSSSIESTREVLIDDHVIISNNVIIRDNNSHPTDPKKRIILSESGYNSKLWNWNNADSAPVHIERNVWIGERAIIYKGVKIGEGSIVAGGSVVTKNVPSYSIVAGNPARVVKKIATE